MSDPSPEDLEEAQRWRQEAHEELLIAPRVARDDELVNRATCFHAHLAAE